jgi:hypothetical protein
VKTEQAVLRITPAAGLRGLHTLKVRATAQAGKYPVISEATVLVELLPPRYTKH